MKIKILSEQEKREIESHLKKQFGVKSVPGSIIAWGKERLMLFTGEISGKELEAIESSAPIEKIGVYFAKLINDELKLTIEGTQALSSQINKNIFEINEKDAEQWMMGRELNISTGMKGFIVIKNKETQDFLGCGKASEHKIGNFIPKSRRLKQRG